MKGGCAEPEPEVVEVELVVVVGEVASGCPSLP